MGVIDEYFQLQQKYNQKYGKCTVILYQKGSFYNIYEFDPRDLINTPNNSPYNEPIGHAVKLSSILNMELTRDNKSKSYNYYNCHMIGFPCIAYNNSRYRNTLLNHGFTIIRIDETGPRNNIRRVVGEIISPGTEIERIDGLPATNSIVSIYIECSKTNRKHDRFLIICGVSSIDVSTGKNLVTEAYSRKDDDIHALQEVYRFLLSQHPREVIINLYNFLSEKINSYERFLRETLDLNRYGNIIINFNEVNKDYLKIEYQRQFLSKLFHSNIRKNKIYHTIIPNVPCSSKEASVLGQKAKNIPIINSSIIQELGLERLSYGIISYILLLQYCYEHNDAIIQKIHPPDTKWIDEDQHLILTHNAILQLNLYPPPRNSQWEQLSNMPGRAIDSLFSIINHTSTVLGRRYLEGMLLNPIINSKILNNYYSMIEELMNDSELLINVEANLKGLPDIERLQRKLQLLLIKPNELAILFNAYIKLINLHIIIDNSSASRLKTLLFDSNEINQFNSCSQMVSSLIDLKKLEVCHLIEKKIGNTGNIEYLLEFNTPFIRGGQNKLIDERWQQMQQDKCKLENIHSHLNELLTNKRSSQPVEFRSPLMKANRKIKNEEDEIVGIGLFVTKARAEKLRNLDVNHQLTGVLSFTPVTGGKMMISSNIIDDCCSRLENTKSELRKHLYNQYIQILNRINEFKFFSAVTRMISKVDFIKSQTKSAMKYGYHKPIIDESASSYCEIKDLRHPIIERLLDDEYIPNDICIGRSSDEIMMTPYGILLYGCNASGKSSLAKAIALIIIMAQSGGYTPGWLKYSPYHRIITRLSGNDDIFKGQSSFVVEMAELRTILRNTNNHTLVLGDELCRGTETISATSLTAATILTLLERKCSFIFATHQHHLIKLEQINNIKNDQLRICHLTVTHDDENDLLIYDRKLKNGPGDSVYGLEVARSLNIDPSFIKLANNIRKQVSGINQEFLSSKKSHFNSSVYMDVCFMCNKQLAETKLDTHHIKEQHKADANGLIDHIPKNASYNLVTLCNECHRKIHSEKRHLSPKQTINGLILTVSPDK